MPLGVWLSATEVSIAKDTMSAMGVFPALLSPRKTSDVRLSEGNRGPRAYWKNPLPMLLKDSG